MDSIKSLIILGALCVIWMQASAQIRCSASFSQEKCSRGEEVFVPDDGGALMCNVTSSLCISGPSCSWQTACNVLIPIGGWYPGENMEACTSVCLSNGLSCEAQGMANVNTVERMSNVSAAVPSVQCDKFVASDMYIFTPAKSVGSNYCYYPAQGSPEPNCDKMQEYAVRFCCCGSLYACDRISGALQC